MDELVAFLIENGGVAAVLATFVIYLARQMRQDRKFMEDRLTKIIEADQKSREASTKVTTELIAYLKTKNGSK